MDEQYLHIRALISEIAAASDFVVAAARRAGLDDQQSHHCQLAIDEVCTNIVEHGSNAESHDAYINIRVQSFPDRFVIQIRDDSRPFDPLRRPDPDPTVALEDRGTGGWGIFFVKKVMDDVHYEWVNGHNQLTLTKRITTNAQESDDQLVQISTRFGDIRLVTPKGRLDHVGTPRLERALSTQLEAGHKHLILDMTGVDFVSSRALKMLVSQWKRARDMRGDLVLVGLSTRVREVFSMIGFDLVFSILASTDEALTLYQSRQ